LRLDAAGARSSADQRERAKSRTQGKHRATSRFIIPLAMIIVAILAFG
jgi:hypothetical protein